MRKERAPSIKSIRTLFINPDSKRTGITSGTYYFQKLFRSLNCYSDFLYDSTPLVSDGQRNVKFIS